MNKTKEFKMAVIEQVFLDQRVKSGFDIQSLPKQKTDAMLDVIGGLLFDESWQMNMPIEEQNG